MREVSDIGRKEKKRGREETGCSDRRGEGCQTSGKEKEEEEH